MSILVEIWPGLVKEDTEQKMTYFSKLMAIADQYSPKVSYEGDLHLVRALDSFQVVI